MNCWKPSSIVWLIWIDLSIASSGSVPPSSSSTTSISSTTSTSTSSTTTTSTVSSTSVTTKPSTTLPSSSTSTTEVTGSTVGSNSALETPGFTISSNQSAFSCCNCQASDRIAGLTAAVVVLAILLGVTAVVLASLVVYTLRKSNRRQDSSRLPAPATEYPPPQGRVYEKLRHGLRISESSMTSIQAATNVGDETYEEVGVS